MSEWVWHMAYQHGDASVVLADRDTIGGIIDTIGAALLNARWPWRVGLGRPMWRLAEALLTVAEKHTRTVVEIQADATLIEVLQQQGLIDREGVAEDCRRKAADGAHGTDPTPTATPAGDDETGEAPDTQETAPATPPYPEEYT